jgi:hypothetical protein
MTVQDVQALDFGYLSGQDLLDFSQSQLLINAEINSGTTGLLTRSVTKAYAEIISQLSARCEIATELKKTFPTGTDPDTRSQIIVKYVSLMAIKNILSRVAGIPDHLKANFAETNEAILSIRNGQSAIPDLQFESTENQPNISRPKIISSSFNTIG